MAVPFWIENAFFRRSDFLSERLPQPEPSFKKIMNARLISRRGIDDNRKVFENILPAFDRVKASGIWGIEIDIQWTRDLQPVRDFHLLSLCPQRFSAISAIPPETMIPIASTNARHLNMLYRGQAMRRRLLSQSPVRCLPLGRVYVNNMKNRLPMTAFSCSCQRK